MLPTVQPVPGMAANDGLGPEGRKKLKIAAVPRGWPSRAAKAAGQPLSKPSTPGVPGGVVTSTPQLPGPAAIFDEGAATVNGLDGTIPAERALAKFAMSSVGFEVLM